MMNQTPRKFSLILILSLIVLSFFMPLVSPAARADINVQFATQDPVGQQYVIYQVRQEGMVQLGTFNTTDNLTMSDGRPLDVSSYVIMIKPSSVDFIHNPIALWNWLAASPGAAVALLVAGGVVGLFFGAILIVPLILKRR